MRASPQTLARFTFVLLPCATILTLAVACESNDRAPTAVGAISAPAPLPQATRLLVQPSQLTLAPGDVAEVQAILVDDQGRALESGLISWTSTDREIADVNEAGLVFAMASGVARVIASYQGMEAYAEVTVGHGPFLVRTPRREVSAIGRKNPR